MTEQNKVLFEVINCHNGAGIGLASLNKPAALNALDSDMITLLTAQLLAWRNDAGVCMVILYSQLDKAFCAGGDVVAMYNAMCSNNTKQAPPALQDFFSTEYQLDYLIHTYEKPVLLWGHGIIMGGGLGLMAGASHRIVTETSRIAMPEISIGLYPDVGASYFLNRMPKGCGLLLGLTGASVNACDALYCQLADYVIPHANKAAFIQKLQASDWQRDPQVNHLLLYALCRENEDKSVLPTANLLNQQSLCAELAACQTVAEAQQLILAKDSADDSWLTKAQHTLVRGSNISKHLVFAQLKRAVDYSLADCFRMELVMSCHCGTVGEFQEGVRALLVDKDNNPQWLYADVDSVPQHLIEQFFISPWSAEQHPLAALGTHSWQ